MKVKKNVGVKKLEVGNTDEGKKKVLSRVGDS